MNFEPELKRQYTTAMILSYVLMGCIFFYGGLAYVLINFLDRSGPSFEHYRFLRNFFLIVAIVGLGVIPKVRQYVLNQPPNMKEDAPQEKRVELYIKRLHTTTVVTLAICENPALFGFILAFLSGNMNEFYIFAALSIFGLLANFPKYEQWRSWIQNKVFS